jgi:TonB family protein
LRWSRKRDILHVMPMTALAALLFASSAPALPADVAPTPIGPMLVTWSPTTIRCGDIDVAPIRALRPDPTLGWGNPPPAAPVVLRFRIDADGRALSIAREGAPYLTNDDLAPALAAARFAPGAAHRDCRLTYVQEATPLAAADLRDLAAYSLHPINGRMPQAGWDRLKPSGSTCTDEPRPPVLRQDFPDARKVSGVPGERAWSLVGYDLDAKGRVVHATTVTGSGHASLDAAALKAMAAWRHAAGNRTGCHYPFWRAASPIVAPAAPEPDTLRQPGQCPPGEWAQQPRLIYPANWQYRAIEGWAIVAFDVAPWGETGNVRMLASEPADAFGQQAVQVIRSARRAPSTTGATGCVERVRFVMRGNETLGGGVPPTGD